MEIGLVASIIQVAGAGLKLSIALYEYADGVSSADKRAKDIARDVELTSLVIQELGRVFERDDTAGVMSTGAVGTAEKAIADCQSVFGELNVVLEKTQKKGIGKWTMPFRESKIQLLRDNLGRLKHTLQLLMQVLIHAHQVETNKEDKAEIRRQRQELKKLIELKKQSIKKYEDSLKNFNSSEESTLVDPAEYTPQTTPQTASSTISSFKNFGLMAMTHLTPSLQNGIFAYNNKPDNGEPHGDLEKGLDLSTEMNDTAKPTIYARRNESTPDKVQTGRDRKGRITAQTLALCVQHIQGLLKEIEAVERGLDHHRPRADLNQELKESYAKTRSNLDAIIDGTPQVVDPISYAPTYPQTEMYHHKLSNRYQEQLSHPGFSQAEVVVPRRPTLQRKGTLGSYYANTPYNQVGSIQYDKDWGVDVTTRYEIERWPADGRPPETEIIERRHQISYADANKTRSRDRHARDRDRIDNRLEAYSVRGRRNEYADSYHEDTYARDRRARRLERARRTEYAAHLGSYDAESDEKWVERAPYRGSQARTHDERDRRDQDRSRTRTLGRPSVVPLQQPQALAPYDRPYERSASEQLLRPQEYDREELPRTGSYCGEIPDRAVRTYSPPSPSYSPIPSPPYFSGRHNQRPESPTQGEPLAYGRFDSREGMRDEGYKSNYPQINTPSDDDYPAVEMSSARSSSPRRRRPRRYPRETAVAGASAAAAAGITGAAAGAAVGLRGASAALAASREERPRRSTLEEYNRSLEEDFGLLSVNHHHVSKDVPEIAEEPRCWKKTSLREEDLELHPIRTPRDIMKGRAERAERAKRAEKIAQEEAKAKAEWAAKQEESEGKEDYDFESAIQGEEMPESEAAVGAAYAASTSTTKEDDKEESSDSEGEELDDLLRDWTTINGKTWKAAYEGSKVSDDQTIL